MRVLLLDDEDDGLAVAVARCLLVSGQAEVHCLTNADTSPMLRSRRCRTRHVDLRTESSIVAALVDYTTTPTVDVVIPVQERLVEVLGRLRHELASFRPVGTVALVPDPTMFERVDHKWYCHELLQPAGLRVPRTVRAGAPHDQLQAALTSWEGPALRKPSLGWGGMGIRIFDNPRDVLEDLKADPPAAPDSEIIQEHIPGADVGCSFLSENGRIAALTIQRRAMKQWAPFTSALQLEFVHDERVAELASAFAAATGWSGVVNLDLRLDARTGEAVLLEANPRYRATLLGSLAMGVNFPLLHCNLSLGRTVPSVRAGTGRWLSYHAVVQDPRNLGVLATCPQKWIASVDVRTITADVQVEKELATRVLRRAVAVTALRLRSKTTAVTDRARRHVAALRRDAHLEAGRAIESEPKARLAADRASQHTCSLQSVNDEMEREWDQLALRCDATPYMRPGWFRAWMNAFRPAQTLSLLTVRRASELVAALPLVTTRLGVRLPINSETPSFELLSVDTEAAAALASALLDRCRSVDVRFIPASMQEHALVSSAEERGCRVLRQVIRRSPYTRVDHSWETLRNELLGRSRRKWIARQRRQLCEMGDLTFDVHDGESQLRDLLGEGLELEAAGWKGSQGTAILSNPSTTAFYRQLAEWAAASGLLRLHFLRLDGKPLAFEFALEQAGVQHVLKTAYNEEMRRYGPGILILEEGLSYASEQPHLHISESLGADDPYKLEFSTGVHEQLRISVFANTVPGTAAWLWRQAVDRSQDQLRRRLSASNRQRLVRLARSTGLMR